MLCSYDDLCYIICAVLPGRYCVIQYSCCNRNKNHYYYLIIIAKSEYWTPKPNNDKPTATAALKHSFHMFRETNVTPGDFDL